MSTLHLLQATPAQKPMTIAPPFGRVFAAATLALFLARPGVALAATGTHAASAAAAQVSETGAKISAAASVPQSAAQSASAKAGAGLASAREQASSTAKGATDRLSPKRFLGLVKIEVPDLLRAAKIRRADVSPKVTSPRTLTYKSRLARVSRWIGPLTLGLLNYVPFETMNADVSGDVNNLMAEENISVEKSVAEAFEAEVKEGKRFTFSGDPEAVFELEVTRYALDPAPTSLARLKPTVSVTGRLRDPQGRLLWCGKGFSTAFENGIPGATLEQYLADPERLRSDFAATAVVAARRLATQANALPKASVKVEPAASPAVSPRK